MSSRFRIERKRPGVIYGLAYRQTLSGAHKCAAAMMDEYDVQSGMRPLKIEIQERRHYDEYGHQHWVTIETVE